MLLLLMAEKEEIKANGQRAEQEAMPNLYGTENRERIHSRSSKAGSSRDRMMLQEKGIRGGSTQRNVASRKETKNKNGLPSCREKGNGGGFNKITTTKANEKSL